MIAALVVRGIAVKRLLVLVLALPFALFSAGPAAAFQVISEVGPHGDFWLDDSMATPGGTCNYGEIVYTNWAYLISMKVRAPHVLAADRNSELRDHRVVTWQWKLQKKRYDATQWKNVKSSAIQRKTAYEDQQASFSAMTIKYNSEKDDPGHVYGTNVIFRALVIIKWYKPNGDVESTVKLVPDWYKVNTYWDEQPNNAQCNRVDTNG